MNLPTIAEAFGFNTRRSCCFTGTLFALAAYCSELDDDS